MTRKSLSKVVLISCVSKKLGHPTPAGQLYTSTLFTLSLKYARQLRPSAIYILSAKYGLVGLHQVIAPYDETLNRMDARARRQWAARVLRQLRQQVDIEQTHFIQETKTAAFSARTSGARC